MCVCKYLVYPLHHDEPPVEHLLHPCVLPLHLLQPGLKIGHVVVLEVLDGAAGEVEAVLDTPVDTLVAGEWNNGMEGKWEERDRWGEEGRGGERR